MNNLIDKLKESKFTFESIEGNNYNWCNSNKSKVTVQLECGHSVKRAISTLYNKKIASCKKCKNMDKYGYDLDTKTLKCGTCNREHLNVPETGLSRWKCCYCKKNSLDKPEVVLLQRLNDNKFNASKSYWFNKDNGSLTGDIYFERDGIKWVIEVDDNNHKGIGRKSHTKKDAIILNNVNRDVKMIRVHRNDIKKLLINIEKILDYDELLIICRNYSKEAEDLYDDLYHEVDDEDIIII